MLKIDLKTIPSSKQRYQTCGDYYQSGGKTLIRVSQMSDWRYEVLVAVHELVEWAIIKHQGIDEKKITAFDLKFEKEREEGLHSEESEPGDDPRSPYRSAHFCATTIERIVAVALGVNWEAYGCAVYGVTLLVYKGVPHG